MKPDQPSERQFWVYAYLKLKYKELLIGGVLVILFAVTAVNFGLERKNIALFPNWLIPQWLKVDFIVYEPASTPLHSIIFVISRDTLAKGLPHYKVKSTLAVYMIPIRDISGPLELSDGVIQYVDLEYMPLFFHCNKSSFYLSAVFDGKDGPKILQIGGDQLRLERSQYFSNSRYGEKALYNNLDEAVNFYRFAPFVPRIPLSHFRLVEGKVQTTSLALVPPTSGLGLPVWYGAYRNANGHYRSIWLYAVLKN